jgi:hypothetical protein
VRLTRIVDRPADLRRLVEAALHVARAERHHCTEQQQSALLRRHQSDESLTRRRRLHGAVREEVLIIVDDAVVLHRFQRCHTLPCGDEDDVEQDDDASAEQQLVVADLHNAQVLAREDAPH